MRRTVRTIAALVALAATASASATAKSPLQGLWQRGSMQVEIAPCGSRLCGTVIKASPAKQEDARRGSGKDLIGSRLLSDIKPTGANRYHGRLWVFDRDTYTDGTIHLLDADQVEVEGCLLLVVCKTKLWKRVR